MEPQLIHINWVGPFSLQKVSELGKGSSESSESKDSPGIYQIYGGHTVYGSNVLLYIGKAEKETFSQRFRSHNWSENNDFKNITVYLGYFAGYEKKTYAEWMRAIDLAEKLLIFSHSPACNSKNIQDIPGKDLLNVHVLNWGSHRDLLPEASGARWTRTYYVGRDINDYKDYSKDNVT
jgi:hypothetical protein